MELSPYVDALRADLAAAAAAGDDRTRETAHLLTAAIDPALRLCLLDALSAMAAEVTDGTDLLEVEIRMHGREPQVVVTSVEVLADEPAPPPVADEDDDRGTARITLRLPEPLKAQAEERAAAEGLSVNAWLVRAVGGALRQAGQPGPFGQSAVTTKGRRITGFARS